MGSDFTVRTQGHCVLLSGARSPCAVLSQKATNMLVIIRRVQRKYSLTLKRPVRHQLPSRLGEHFVLFHFMPLYFQKSRVELNHEKASHYGRQNGFFVRINMKRSTS